MNKSMNETLKYCNNCGEPIEDSAMRFCSNYGMAVEQELAGPGSGEKALETRGHMGADRAKYHA